MMYDTCIFLVAVIALIVIILIKRHKKRSYDMDDKSDTIDLKSLAVKPTNKDADNDYVFSNPTYQDEQGFNGNDDDEVLVHSKS